MFTTAVFFKILIKALIISCNSAKQSTELKLVCEPNGKRLRILISCNCKLSVLKIFNVIGTEANVAAVPLTQTNTSDNQALQSHSKVPNDFDL